MDAPLLPLNLPVSNTSNWAIKWLVKLNVSQQQHRHQRLTPNTVIYTTRIAGIDLVAAALLFTTTHSLVGTVEGGMSVVE